jgi:O-antigen/teichoic acid export membrane protein
MFSTPAAGCRPKPPSGEGKANVKLKSIGQNALVYAAGNIGLRVSSFLMIPLYTHYLSMGDFGLLSTLLLTIQVLMIVMGMGGATSMVRFAREYEDRGEMASLIGGMVAACLSTCLVVSAGVIGFSEPLFRSILHTDQVRLYVSLSCFAAATQSIFIATLSYFRAKNEGGKFTSAALGAALLLLLINWVFLVRCDMGVKGVLIAQIVTYGGMWGVLILRIGLKTGIRFRLQTFRRLVIFGFPLIFAMAGNVATDTSAIYFLSFHRGLEDVAIYSLGYKIASITGIVLILPFELAYEPFVYANKDRPEIQRTISRLLTYLMFCFLFVSLGVVFVFRPLFPFIAPEAYAGAYRVTILMFAGFAFSGFRAVGQSLLHIHNKTSVTGGSILAITLASILFQYLLVPKMGVGGVILIFIFSNLGIGATLMILGIQAFPVPVEKFRIGVAGILFGCCMVISFHLWNRSWFLFYSLPAFAALSIPVLLYRTPFFQADEKHAIHCHWERMMVFMRHKTFAKNG